MSPHSPKAKPWSSARAASPEAASRAAASTKLPARRLLPVLVATAGRWFMIGRSFRELMRLRDEGERTRADGARAPSSLSALRADFISNLCRMGDGGGAGAIFSLGNV